MDNNLTIDGNICGNKPILVKPACLHNPMQRQYNEEPSKKTLNSLRRKLLFSFHLIHSMLLLSAQ